MDDKINNQVMMFYDMHRKCNRSDDSFLNIEVEIVLFLCSNNSDMTPPISKSEDGIILVYSNLIHCYDDIVLLRNIRYEPLFMI